MENKYDELEDIQNAIKGDFGAKLRVEITSPWCGLVESKFKELSMEKDPIIRQSLVNDIMSNNVLAFATCVAFIFGNVRSGIPLLDRVLVDGFLEAVYKESIKLMERNYTSRRASGKDE